MSKERKDPHPVEKVRELLAGRKELCSPGCKGWDIFDTDRGLEIERCDECADGLDLRDDDVAELPEAQEALKKALVIQGQRIAEADYGQLYMLMEAKFGVPAKNPTHPPVIVLPEDFGEQLGFYGVHGDREDGRSPYTVYGVRQILSRDRIPCSKEGCKGWSIEVDTTGKEFFIEACQECQYKGEQPEPTDVDIMQLPEAWRALEQAERSLREKGKVTTDGATPSPPVPEIWCGEYRYTNPDGGFNEFEFFAVSEEAAHRHVLESVLGYLCGDDSRRVLISTLELMQALGRYEAAISLFNEARVTDGSGSPIQVTVEKVAVLT